MEELVKLTEYNGKNAISARDLHEYLVRKANGGQTGKMFSHWIKQRIEKYSYKLGIDYIIHTYDTFGNLLAQDGKSNNQYVAKIDYIMTMDMAKELCMLQANERGKKAREYFIACEEKLKQITSPKLPQNYAEALRELANEVEQKEKLQLVNKMLAPKAEFFDQVTSSKDAIDVGSAAKVLNMGIGRTKLFAFLRDQGVLMENSQPYQKYIDCGYFRTIEQKYTKPDGTTCINIKTVVYQKGLAGIRRLLIKVENNPNYNLKNDDK